MTKVRIIHCGVEGEGSNVTRAKQDAARKVERCINDGFTPVIISHPAYPDHVGFVFRDSITGWGYHIHNGPKLTMRENAEDNAGSVIPSVVTHIYGNGGYATRDSAVRSCRKHMAQYVFHPANHNQQSGCEFLAGEDLREHIGYVAWQIDYRRLVLSGKSETESHSSATRNWALVADLVAKFLPNIKAA